MNEKVMQFILENKFYDEENLRTVCGQKITIKFLGVPNADQGPDFLHSRILIDKTEWAGNIELHVNTSDWIIHRHHLDKNYINVVLHIVWKHDTNKFIHSHVLLLSDYVNMTWLDDNLINAIQFVKHPCSYPLKRPLSSDVFDWLFKMGEKRLDTKVNAILLELDSVKGDWDEVAWRVIASNFGHKVNSGVFHQIACSLSFKLINKFKYDPILIECLLMGQAGLLNNDFNDAYPIQQKKAYKRLKSIYALKEISLPLYFLRMRPQNFPTIRLSQLAVFLNKTPSVFDILENQYDLSDILSRLRVASSEYWDSHFVFDRESKKKIKLMGIDFTYNLISNSIIPLMISYGISTGKNQLIKKGKDWLLSIPPENNKNLRFLKHVIIPKNSYESQMALELFNNYCKNDRCDECLIAREIRQSEFLKNQSQL
jgi:hypothetical protein